MISAPRCKEYFFTAGRFKIGLTTDLPCLVNELSEFYLFEDKVDHCDFHVSLCRARGLRRYIKPQVSFSFAHSAPFDPFPISHAFPLLEWGLNWCVTRFYHQCLVMHAAVVEKQGKVIVLPGEPGAGKSTLSTALVGAGWSLFSDELTLIRLSDSNVLPNPRPISLKNQSIGIVGKRLPDLYLSPPVLDTVKGAVALLDTGAVKYNVQSYFAEPELLIFPRLNLGGETILKPLSKAEALIRFAEQGFNYSIIGGEAFKALAKFTDRSRCYEFEYDGNLDEAIEVVNNLL